MKNFTHILRFEWKNLWRNNTLAVLLLVFLGTGIYGIYFGKFEIEKQQARMAIVQDHERAQFDSLMAWIDLDTAIAGNKLKFQKAVTPTGAGRGRHFTYYLTNETPPLAGLCLGQRDLYPVYYGFHVGDLARQVNVGELANPMKLLTGNFDLSYVYVFLLPLLLITLFHNLYAAEKEGGTLSLLQAQPVSLNVILWSKGFLRLLIVWGVSAFLLLLGFILQGIPIAEQGGLFFQWLFAIFGYALLWTVLMAGIVALKQGTALSAMLGLGVWLLFTLITPALLNLIVSANEPLPNRAEALHHVRTLNDKIWESPKSFVWEKFHAAYPQYNQKDTADFNKWYYASFTLLDQETKELNEQYEAQVKRRNALLEQWEWLAPAALVHEYLSGVSNTDRDSHRQFMQSLYDFHGELKTIYYTKIFMDDYFDKTDLKGLQAKLEE